MVWPTNSQNLIINCGSRRPITHRAVAQHDTFLLCNEAEALVSLVLDGAGFGSERFADNVKRNR